MFDICYRVPLALEGSVWDGLPFVVGPFWVF